MIPTTINTDERIFKIETFEDETFLCNTKTAKEYLERGEIKKLWNLWNFEFKVYGKGTLKEM